MTDLVEEAGTESGEVTPSSEDVGKLLDQLDILDRDEYHVIIPRKYFEKNYSPLEYNVRYFTTDVDGMSLHFYRVYFYNNVGYNHKRVQQVPDQFDYLGGERIPAACLQSK